MQKKVQIISDGSQDLSPELSKEKDIEVVPFYVSFDGEHYYKEIEEITVRDFYQQTERGRNFQFRHYQKPSEIDAEGCGDDGKIPG